MRRIAALALLLAIGSCAAPRAPAPAPVLVAPPPRPAPPVVAATSDWRDWPLTPGDWSYRQDARGTIALFGVPGADAELTLRCDRAARQIFLSRRMVPQTPPGVTVRTSTLVRSLAMVPVGGGAGYVAIGLAVNDPLLDAIGFSRGRFVVQQPGAPALVVPAWAEILRVTEDCRG